MTKIIEQVLHNDSGEKVGKIAIMFCMDLDELKKSVAKYVGDVPHNQFTDITFLNPWTRVIISGINKLDFHSFEAIKRNQKIDELLK